MTNTITPARTNENIYQPVNYIRSIEYSLIVTEFTSVGVYTKNIIFCEYNYTYSLFY